MRTVGLAVVALALVGLMLYAADRALEMSITGKGDTTIPILVMIVSFFSVAALFRRR